MTFDQIAISAILICTLVLSVWGRWRYDVVAVLSLMAGVGFGVIDPDAAFAGFGNAAVVTVAAVLAISHALGRSEEHTSELQSLMRISYAVFCLKKKKR